MGFPLFSAPFLAPHLGVQYTVTFLALPMFLTSVYMTLNEGRLLSILRRFWSLIVLLFPGTWLGVLGLSVLDPSVLFIVLGLVTIMFVLLNFVQIKSNLSSQQEIWMSPTVGLLAGLTGGMTAIYGPPISIFLVTLRLEKNEFAASVVLINLFASVPLLSSLVVRGLLGLEEAIFSASASLPVFIGMVLGRKLRSIIDQELFTRIVLIVLLVGGVNLVRKAFM